MHREAGLAPPRRQPFDWIFERAQASPSRPAKAERVRKHPPNVERQSKAAGDLTAKLLELCGARIGQNRILEVTDSSPALVESLDRLGLVGYMVLLTGEVDPRPWAGRFPRFTFLSGSPEDCLAPGRQFDRIAASARGRRCVANRIAVLAPFVARRGTLLLSASAEEDWTNCRAAHDRAGLRLVDQIPVDLGHTLLVSQRR